MQPLAKNCVMAGKASSTNKFFSFTEGLAIDLKDVSLVDSDQ